jgi:hypothetical protein
MYLDTLPVDRRSTVEENDDAQDTREGADVVRAERTYLLGMTVAQALDLVGALVSAVRDKGPGTVYMHVFQRGKSLYVRSGGARRKK